MYWVLAEQEEDQCWLHWSSCIQLMLDAQILEFLLQYRACILFLLPQWGSTGRKYLIDEMNCLVTITQIYGQVLQRILAECKGDKRWPLALVSRPIVALSVSVWCKKPTSGPMSMHFFLVIAVSLSLCTSPLVWMIHLYHLQVKHPKRENMGNASQQITVTLQVPVSHQYSSRSELCFHAWG